ncbi:MAG TPA: hypothetical protein PKM88_13760, partial [bacterium]|nr:hypothetical protein [bacterium]
MANGLAGAWLAGAQQSIDFAWKQHMARLQSSEDARAQRRDDFAYSAAVKAQAERERINADAAKKLAAAEWKRMLPPASPALTQQPQPRPAPAPAAAPTLTMPNTIAETGFVPAGQPGQPAIGPQQASG